LLNEVSFYLYFDLLRANSHKKPNCRWDSRPYCLTADYNRLLLNSISSCFRDIGL